MFTPTQPSKTKVELRKLEREYTLATARLTKGLTIALSMILSVVADSIVERITIIVSNRELLVLMGFVAVGSAIYLIAALRRVLRLKTMIARARELRRGQTESKLQ